MSAEIIDLNANKPHEVCEVICVKCNHRYIAVTPVGITPMKNWECGGCGECGGIIRTGQPVNEDGNHE